MSVIYASIMKIKHLCKCNENIISTSCQISMAELNGLSVMENNKVISCSDFSEKMSLSPSRGSRIIDSLVKKGYLLRKTKEDDRRITLLFLTKKGLEVKNELSNQQAAFDKKLEKELTKKEIDIINSGLNLLENFFKKTNQKGD